MEEQNYLEKPQGRRKRMDRSAKARNKRKFAKDKRDREYEEGFGGNLD